MFFFAVFGVEDKDKYLGTCNNTICPSCGGFTTFEVHKSYRAFSIFFIPVIRWNVRYFVKTRCCGSLYELDPAVGKEFERNPGTIIRKENLRPINQRLPFKYCPNCKMELPEEFSYCPYCSGRL